jgi:hypothetical protein
MTCCCCKKPIKANAARSYAYVSNGHGGTRKVYACAKCCKVYPRLVFDPNASSHHQPIFETTSKFDEFLDKTSIGAKP